MHLYNRTNMDLVSLRTPAPSKMNRTKMVEHRCTMVLVNMMGQNRLHGRLADYYDTTVYYADELDNRERIHSKLANLLVDRMRRR